RASSAVIYPLSLHDALPIFVAIVIALRVRRVRTPRLDDDGAHDRGRDQCAVWIGANHAFGDELLHNDDDALRRERRLFLDAQQSDRKSTRLNSSHVSISYAV